MILPAYPDNEAIRLQELLSYQILDSEEELLYDNITKLAAEICGAKISLITFVDSNRQWFKSKFGIDTQETGRDLSFCAHCILNPDELLIIKNTHLDNRFHDNPLVTEDPNINFYAGVPLVNKNGAALGTLCVIHNEPKELTENQIEALQSLASQVIILLEYRKNEIELKKKSADLISKSNELENFFSLNLDLFCIANFNGKFVKLNQVWESALGYSTNELLLINFLDLVHPEDLQATKKTIQKLENNEIVHSFTVRFRCKNGFYKTLEWNAHTVDNLMYAVARDVTEIKVKNEQIRESEEKFRKLTENLPGVVYLCKYDEHYTTIYINDKALQLTGYSAEEMTRGTIHFDHLYHPEDKEAVNLAVEEAISNNRPFHLTYRIIHKDGNIKWIEEWGEGIFENGELLFLEGFMADITERKKAEDEQVKIKLLLEKTSKSLSITLNEKNAIISALDKSAIVSITDLKGNIIKANDYFCQISGYSFEELDGKNHSIVNSKYHPKEFWADMWETVSSGQSWRAEVCNKAKDGSLYWVDTVINPIYDNDGNMIQFMSIRYLITTRKNTEQELIKTKDLLEQTSELAKIGAFEVFFNDNKVNWSKTARDIHECEDGYTPDLLGCLNFFKEGEHKNKMSELMNNAVMTGSSFDEEAIIVTTAGNEKWVRVLAQAEIDKDNCKRLFGTFQDINQDKINRELISKEREKLINVIEGTNSGTWEWNVQSGETVFNERWAEIAGYTLDELQPVDIYTWINLFHPDDFQKSDKILKEHFQGITEYYECEARIKHKKGHWVWVLDRGKVLTKTKDDKPLMMFGTHQDISRSKLADEWQRQFINEAPSAMALLDNKFCFLAASKRWISDYLLDHVDFIGKNYYEIFSKQDNQLKVDTSLGYGWKNIFNDCIKGNVRESNEQKFTDSNGKSRWLKWKINPWYNDSGNIGGLIILTEDITQIKESKEEELKHILKLTQSQNDRLKNYAHIVSHNLRSHSGNIQSLINLILEEKPDLLEDELLLMMQQASDNLMETIGHLSEVAIMNVSENETLSKIKLFDTLNHAIESVSVLARNANVKIYNELNGTEIVEGIPAYLDSIFLNFLTNGIKYRALNRDSYVTVSSENIGDYLKIIIQDNGLGIDMKRHGNKIFGMYKTFHKNADARGIGLFITKNQIEAMGGRIEVESEEGRGTKFIVTLKKES